MRPLKTRSGLKTVKKSCSALSPLAASSATEMRPRVVPTGSVVSIAIVVPACRPAPIAATAASSAPQSGLAFPSTASGGTATTRSGPSATAAVVSSWARSAPLAITSASACSSPASPGNGGSARLTSSTTSGLMSQPTTLWPLRAICTASGSPILPSATTTTCIRRPRRSVSR